MAIHKTEVVILRRQEIRETSLILIAFSRDIGKIHGLVKGVRGARAAVPWYLEPLTLQSVVFYERRRSPLGLIGSCDLIDPFDFIRRDLVRTAYAGFCLDLVDAMTEVGDSHPEIFQLLVDVLKAICQGMDPRRAARFFEAHLLRECGLLPDPETLSLSPEGVVILRKILEGPISSIEKWNFPAELDEQLRIRFQNCVREALNRELKSRIFLQAIGLEGDPDFSRQSDQGRTSVPGIGPGGEKFSQIQCQSGENNQTLKNLHGIAAGSACRDTKERAQPVASALLAGTEVRPSSQANNGLLASRPSDGSQ